MSKKDSLMKGFDKLLQTTEPQAEGSQAEATKAKKLIKISMRHNIQASESSNAEKYKRLKNAKYKELKKCTLYLPPEIMDSLAIMKIRTKKDLSELTAEALREYLKINNFLNV